MARFDLKGRSGGAMALALLVAVALPAVAQTVVRDDMYRGYWRSNGVYCPDLAFAGDGTAEGECRGYFGFDISDVTQPVAEASVRLHIENYFGTGAQECVLLMSVEFDPAFVIQGLFNLLIFEDLGNGVAYTDEICVTSADEGSVIEVPLNAAGVAAVDAATGGLFLFGLLSTTIDGSKGPPDFNEGLRFSNMNPNPWENQLELQLIPTTVPALGRAPRLGFGLILLGVGVAILSREAIRNRLAR